MTAMSLKGKKQRKRIQLLHKNHPYGPLLRGKLNPRASELPALMQGGRFGRRYREFVRELIKKRAPC